MDSDQGMYKLRNGSETVKWLADHIEELEGLLAEKLDAYKLGLDTAKRAYQDERDEYEATIKRLRHALLCLRTDVESIFDKASKALEVTDEQTSEA